MPTNQPSAAPTRKMLAVAIDQGWSVGVASGFIHLDRRDFAGLPQNIFDY